MREKSIRLGDLILVLEDISVVLSGGIICRFHLSHKNEPKHSLVEMYAELSDDGELEVLCRTPLSTNRFGIISRFLSLYEKNIIRFFREHAQGKTPDMFKIPMN